MYFFYSQIYSGGNSLAYIYISDLSHIRESTTSATQSLLIVVYQSFLDSNTNMIGHIEAKKLLQSFPQYSAIKYLWLEM